MTSTAPGQSRGGKNKKARLLARIHKPGIDGCAADGDGDGDGDDDGDGDGDSVIS